MSKSNPLCRAQECQSDFGCAHRGPHGEFCFFKVEKKLCEFLGIEWHQHETLDNLLNQIERRLVGSPPEHVASQFRFQPPALSTEEHDDPAT
jgi:hypothetical protein